MKLSAAIPESLSDACMLELRTHRERIGLTQGELAEIAQIEQARLSRYESGHVIPTLEMFFRLCTVLSLSPWAIVKRAEKRFTKVCNP